MQLLASFDDCQKADDRLHSSLAVALNRARMYSPARIGGYWDGASGEQQLGSV